MCWILNDLRSIGAPEYFSVLLPIIWILMLLSIVGGFVGSGFGGIFLAKKIVSRWLRYIEPRAKSSISITASILLLIVTLVAVFLGLPTLVALLVADVMGMVGTYLPVQLPNWAEMTWRSHCG
ncbi:MAG: hypothetical protein AAF609_13320 [Cyanobacteria bacterium P01_C01_bin.120]